MKRLLALLLVFSLIFSLCACGKAETTNVSGTGNEDVDSPYVENGTFRYLYSSEIGTMNYLKTSQTQDFKSSANFVDTLVEYDQYGVVQPCLATEWSASEDGLTWTFKLREGVKWYDSEGKEYGDVTAADFVYGIKYILDPKNESTTVDNVCNVLKNAREYYNGDITDFSQVGIRAIDDYTLEFTLSNNCPYFLSVLTYVCFMPANQKFVESCDGYFGTSADTLLYCGGYICENWEPQSEFSWVKNENYWDAEKVYIQKVIGKYNAEAESLAPELYKRGEIDEAMISTSILDSWLKDEATKTAVRPNRATYDAMWWFFDFAPHFDAEYDNDNYLLAVNNTAWRKSIASGIDRIKALSCYDPYSAKDYIMQTITPQNFVAVDGLDFTQTGELARISNGNPFNSEEALKYKEQAIEELTALGCKFPVTIPYYYRSDEANQGSVAQVVEQQLEGILGADYIDLVPTAGPATNYTQEVRNTGKYGLLEEGWGPDYADPETYAEPWGLGWSYNWPEACTNPEYLTGYTYTQEDFDNGIITDETVIGTQQHIYNKMVEEAKAEKLDIGKRYELFAKAEAWLIDEAFVIPFRVHSNGYVASKLTVFDGEYSAFGVCVWKYKGKHVMKEAMSIEEYSSQYDQWKIDRKAALEKAEVSK